MANTTGLGDTIYAAVKKAIEDAGGSSGGGGGTSTQTLTVTKDNASDTVSVTTVGWSDYIAENEDAMVEVQPDSADGLVSVYSITVGTAFFAEINDNDAAKYLDAEMTTIPFDGTSMPSTPLYAKPAFS